MKNLSIRMKLICGILLLGAIGSIGVVVGYTGMQHSKQSINQITNIYLPSVEILGKIQFHFKSVLTAQTHLLKRNITPEQRAKQYEDIAFHRKQYLEQMERYEQLPKDEAKGYDWGSFKQTLSEARDTNNYIFNNIREWEKDYDNTAPYEIAMKFAYGEGQRNNDALFASIEALIKDDNIASKKVQDTIINTVNNDINLIYICTGISTLLAFLIITYLIISITKPLNYILAASKDFANGDFHKRLKIFSNDEIGKTSVYLNKAFDVVVAKMFWYENIIDSINFPIIIMDLDKNILFANKTLLETLHLSKDALIGKACNILNTSLCNTDNCAIHCAKQGIRQKSFFTLPTHLGKEFSVDVSIIQDENHVEVGYVEVIQDITETNKLKKAAEQALIDGIHQAAAKLEKSIEVITTASEEISTQIEQSTRGSQSQSDQMHETAAAIEEMNSTILEVAKNSNDGVILANDAKDKAHEGNALVTSITDAISHIHEIALNLKSDIALLGTQVVGISEVVTVISNIADQTNLLSLNAAIESSRAGEAGRGFAVVADEVRKLAEKTQNATKEVGKSIKDIQDNTKKNIQNVDNVVASIQDINEQAKKSSTTLSDIVKLIELASDQVRSIAIAADQQSATSEEINKIISNVASIAAESTEAMKQSSIAITELAKQSVDLKDLIDDMKK